MDLSVKARYEMFTTDPTRFKLHDLPMTLPIPIILSTRLAPCGAEVARRRNAGGVVKWLGHSVSNLVGSACAGSSPVVRTRNHKLAANSDDHPFEVGK